MTFSASIIDSENTWRKALRYKKSAAMFVYAWEKLPQRCLHSFPLLFEQALKRRLSRDSALHAADNLRAMQANMGLIKEINELRREAKLIRQTARDAEVDILLFSILFFIQGFFSSDLGTRNWYSSSTSRSQ